jgi:hypothetical protein
VKLEPVAGIVMRGFSWLGGFMSMSELGEVFRTLLIAGIGLGLFFQTIELTRLRRRLAALSRVEAKLNLVLEHAGLKYVPYAHLPASVINALQGGKKIEAIKLYRQATGASLTEAKDLIEEIMAISTSHDTIQMGSVKVKGS